MSDLNKISIGPGATNNATSMELSEMYQLLLFWESQTMQQGVTVGAAAAQAEGDAAHDAQVKMAMSTQASAIGEAIGSGVGGAAEAYGTFGGGQGAVIKEQNSIIENVGDAETTLRPANGNGALVNREASAEEREAALQAFANDKAISPDEANNQKTTLVNKLKHGKGSEFKRPLTADERTLLGTLTKEEKADALANLSSVRKEARDNLRTAQDERSAKMANFRTLGTTLTGLTKGSAQGAASAYQMDQAAYEKQKVILQFVTTAQNNLQQQFSTLYESYKQAQQNLIKNDDAQFQRRG
ncbi:MAG: hypothetical protein JSS32_08095 [Verrucomicrobia bacterium]|nr:hypothetical protein [Verrucomicrobiota bacterium]